MLRLLAASLLAPILPVETPDLATPQYDSGQVTAIIPAPGGVFVGGPGIGVTVERIRNNRRVWSVPGAGTTWALLKVRNGVLVGDDTGVTKYRVGSRKPLWHTSLGGRVSSLERFPGSSRVVVAGRFPGAVTVLSGGGKRLRYPVPAFTGRCCSNSGPTHVYRADMQPQGRRYIAVGEFTAVGGRSRSQAVMLRFGKDRAKVVKWDIRALHYPCARGYPAYLEDAEWNHAGTKVAFVSTGGRHSRLCDAAFVARGTVNSLRVRPIVNHTCTDSLLSVEWAPDDKTIFAGGHQKCAQLTRHEWVQRPRYGMEALRARDLRLRAWKSDKCRGDGGRELTWSGGLWVGYDCATWGNREASNPDPSPILPVSRLAFLPAR
jgi:hypothetical protein